MEVFVTLLCIVTSTIKLTSNPKVSEGSQFHQPPQVPSCRAHQLPKVNAIKFVSKVYPHQLLKIV